MQLYFLTTRRDHRQYVENRQGSQQHLDVGSYALTCRHRLFVKRLSPTSHI
uniref:Uncharacterized protein n=1 Tax=Parascaris univalens TaxID=6257 RepID=A0A915AID8_PARUN